MFDILNYIIHWNLGTHLLFSCTLFIIGNNITLQRFLNGTLGFLYLIIWFLNINLLFWLFFELGFACPENWSVWSVCLLHHACKFNAIDIQYKGFLIKKLCFAFLWAFPIVFHSFIKRKFRFCIWWSKSIAIIFSNVSFRRTIRYIFWIFNYV
jgi:hypothetical protein